MRSRSLNQASRVRSCGRDCLSTNVRSRVMTRTTMFDTPPPNASTRAGPGAIQPFAWQKLKALSAVISNIARRLSRRGGSFLMTVADYAAARGRRQQDVNMDHASFATRWNLDAIEEAYRRWQRDPASVDQDWQFFFEGFELGAGRPAPAVEARCQTGIVRLVDAYRELGHFLADLDPLNPPRQ